MIYLELIFGGNHFETWLEAYISAFSDTLNNELLKNKHKQIFRPGINQHIVCFRLTKRNSYLLCKKELFWLCKQRKSLLFFIIVSSKSTHRKNFIVFRRMSNIQEKLFIQ